MPNPNRVEASAEAQAWADGMFDDVLPSTPEQMALALDAFSAARVRAAVERCCALCHEVYGDDVRAHGGDSPLEVAAKIEAAIIAAFAPERRESEEGGA